MKTMADIRRIVDLYELYGSYKKVARELSISPLFQMFDLRLDLLYIFLNSQESGFIC